MKNVLRKVFAALRYTKPSEQSWKRCRSAIAIVLVFVTTYAMVMPAIALEGEKVSDFAGLDLANRAAGGLNCHFDVHKHTKECYKEVPVYDADGRQTGTNKVLNCGKENWVVHEHDENCYQDGKLVCELPEHKEHKHDAECYTTQRVLSCNKEEVQGHTHTDACYEETKELVCEQQEHVHTDACFAENEENLEKQLICGQEEHIHTDKCYRIEKKLICGLEEETGHTHTDACYTEKEVLTCKELTPHTHDLDCYEKGPDGESAAEMGWVQLKDENDPNCKEVVYGDPDHLICGKTELLVHQHGEECFDEVEDEANSEDLQSDAGEAEPQDDTAIEDLQIVTDEEASSDDDAVSQDGNDAEEQDDAGEEDESVIKLHPDSMEESEDAEGSEDADEKADSQDKQDVNSRTVEVDGASYSLVVTYPVESNIPENAEFRATAIADTRTDYEAYRDRAFAAVDNYNEETETRSRAQEMPGLFDLTIFDEDGNEIQPDAPLQISIDFGAESVTGSEETAEKPAGIFAVHFPGTGVDTVMTPVATNLLSKAAQVLAEKVSGTGAEVIGTRDSEDGTVQFEAESLSVYAIVYTVDFHTEVISAKGDKYEITVTAEADAQIPEGAELRVREITEGDEDYCSIQDDIIENLTDKENAIPKHPVLFDIAIVSGDQEIEPAEGSEVKVEIKLVSGVIKGIFTSNDSPLLVNDAPITQTMSDIDQKVQVIHQVEQGKLDVVDATDTITEEEVVSEFTTSSFSDWLLFLDETVENITIGVNDSLTLRPYSKWVWKKVAEEEQYQNCKWKVPTSSNVISFTEANKTDDQLNETYTYYHGKATRTGEFDLQLTDNGTVVKTIHVTVVNDVPDTPDTIQGTDDIKVNLFDYDINTSDRSKSGSLDTQANVASSNTYRNTSVNKYSDLQFLGYGGSNTTSEWYSINNYTKDKPSQNILEYRLDGGYPKLGKSTNGNTRSKPSLKYLFDTSSKNNDVYAYPDLAGLFQKDNEGYYYYNSNNNYAYYNINGGSNQITLYDHTYSQWTSGSAGPNAKPIGFFPFHKYDSYLKEGNTGMNFNTNLNHHFGMSMTVDFEIPSDGLDDYGNPITFEFSGDDDMWVFIDNNLVLDVGGIHQPVTGSINFSADKVSVYGVADTTITQRFLDANSPTAWEIGDGKPHTMKIFYLERGGCDSNLSVRFNTPKRFGKGKLSLVKREKDKTTPLQGAEFKIWDNPKCEGAPIGTYTSDENGNINFGEFALKSKTDTYYLKETRSPSGYIRDTEIYQIRPRLNTQSEAVKDSSGDYYILDVFKADGTALSKLENDSVIFPNNKIGKIDIPAKKTWIGQPENTASVTLTIQRYRLIDKAKGFMIVKDLSGEPDGYTFDADYIITYPNGQTETISYSQFTNGMYSLQDPVPGSYVIQETVKSTKPDGYTMTHSEQRKELTLEEDGIALADFRTTFARETGKLFIKANLTVENGSSSDIDYSKVRYAILDSTGKKVTSISHAQAVSGTSLNLPVGAYKVKAVSIPHTPDSYERTVQEVVSSESSVQGTVSGTLTVSEGQQTEVNYNTTYVKQNNVQNCTWKIIDQYSDQAHNWQELVYKSGKVEYPVGTKLRMYFQVPQGRSALNTVTYDGQTLTGNRSNVQNMEEYSVEFTVKENAQLSYSINVYNTKSIDITGPYFEVVGHANNASNSSNYSVSRNLANAKASKAGAQLSLDASNEAKHPDAPEGKKYVKDNIWSETVVLNSGNNWQDNNTLKDLPAADEEGNPYYYYVSEVSETGLSESTVCSFDLDNGKQFLVGEDLNSNQALGVTNQKVGSLTLTKKVTVNGLQTFTEWADGTYYFTILDSSGNPAKGKVNGEPIGADGRVTITITNGESSSVTVTDIPVGNYTVTEDEPNNGTELTKIDDVEVSSATINVSIEDNTTAKSFTNNKNLSDMEDTTTQTIEKKWFDDSGEMPAADVAGKSIKYKLKQYRAEVPYTSSDAIFPVVIRMLDASGTEIQSKTYYIKKGVQPTLRINKNDSNRDEIKIHTEWLGGRHQTNYYFEPDEFYDYKQYVYLMPTISAETQVTIQARTTRTNLTSFSIAEGYITDKPKTYIDALDDHFTFEEISSAEISLDAEEKSVHFTLDGVTYSANDKDWKATIEQLPFYNVKDGKFYAYKYDVTEVEVDGETVTLNQDGTGSSGSYAVTYVKAADGGITINNTKQPIDLSILKTDKNDHDIKLKDVKFTLRRIIENPETLSNEIQYAEDISKAIESDPTDKDGITRFSSLRSGFYEIAETTMPKGYVIDGDKTLYIRVASSGLQLLQKDLTKKPKDWTVINAGGIVYNVAQASGTTPAVISVENTPGTALPDTGGPGTKLIYLFGFMLTGLAGAGMFMKRRGRKEA